MKSVTGNVRICIVEEKQEAVCTIPGRYLHKNVAVETRLREIPYISKRQGWM